MKRTPFKLKSSGPYKMMGSSPVKQSIFAEGNNPKKTIEEEASDYRKNTKNRDKTKVDPHTQKYIDYVNTKVGVEGGPKRDKYGNLIK
jgi:hypothetical protein